MKNLTLLMSSCANRNLFAQNSSPQSLLKFIPYKRHEQTAPSWSVGQLNFFNQENQRKWNEKPSQRLQFKSDWHDFWCKSKRSICSTIHPIHSCWSDHSFLKGLLVKLLQFRKFINVRKSSTTEVAIDFSKVKRGLTKRLKYVESLSRTICRNRR